MTDTVKLIIAGVLLVFSFFFAAVENSYPTVNRLRLLRDQKENKFMSNQVLKLAENYNDTVVTTLLGNNIVNIALTALITSIGISYDLANNGAGKYVTLFSAILFIIILVFGEIMPKTIGLKFNYRLSYLFVFPFLFFRYLFFPIVYLVNQLIKLFNMFGHKKSKLVYEHLDAYTEDELQVIVDEIEESGQIDEETSDLVRSALEFTETEAYEIMTPRVDVFAFDIDDDISELMKEQDIFRYSRVPVYQDTIDNIIGVLPTKLLLKLYLSKQKLNIRSLMRPSLFVHHSKRISEILSEFKLTKNHLAVVIDEYGGTEGIITMEDIIEEIIGEIWDESDEINEPITLLEDGRYLIDGNVNLEDFFELLRIAEDEETDYDTVGGWCLDILDRFAQVGDEFKYGRYLIRIVEIDGFAVEKIEVRKLIDSVE